MSKSALVPVGGLALLLLTGIAVLAVVGIGDRHRNASYPIVPSSQPAGYHRIADLADDAFSINTGMGCTYDQAKTISATRDRLSTIYGDDLASIVEIVFCNMDQAGTVTLGALVPSVIDPDTYTPTPPCDVNGLTPSTLSCLPTGPAEIPTIQRLVVPFSELSP